MCGILSRPIRAALSASHVRFQPWTYQLSGVLVERVEAIWSSELSPADGEAYDEFVAVARGGHYSQTRRWAKPATTGRPFVARYFLARRQGRVVGAALILKTRVLNAVTLPFVQTERGPVVDDPEVLPEVLDSLVYQARSHGILRLSVMPYWAGEDKSQVERMLRRARFADAQSFHGRHARTLRLDLSGLSADDLFAGSALSQVRQNVRRAQRAGAVVRPGQKCDMDAVRAMHKQLLHASRHPGAAWYEALAEYFQSCGAMFVCEHQGEVISAIFVARHGELATYALGFSSADDVRFPKMILPLASAIAWAKENGVKCFDLGGIPLEHDADVKRASIAEFKRSFSRAEISLVREHAHWL